MVDLEDARQHVEDTKGTDNAAGLTTIRHDADVVNTAKQDMGVSQNNEIAPLLDAVIADYFDDEETAEEKMKEFKDQFEDE